jgi:tetratricopeptide (TPR) repeat protein
MRWLLSLAAWASPEDAHPARQSFLARQELSADPTDPARWTRLAELASDPALAVSLYREALRIDPDWVPALVGLGEALAGVGDPGEAVRVLARAQDLAPDSLEPALALAEVQRDAALARQLWARFPDRAEVALLVARLEPASRLEVLSQAPPAPDVLEVLIEARLSAGDAPGAAEALARLGERAPAQLARLVACAQAGTLSGAGYQALLGRRREALARPGGAGAMPSLPPEAQRCPAALALQAQLSPAPEAERWLRQALALGPDAGLSVELARVQLELGEAADALGRLEAARPGDAEVELLYARALRDLRQPERAREVLLAAAAQHPDHPGLVLALADLEPPVQALSRLLEALRRLADPALEARARALAEQLDQGEAVSRALLEEPLAMQRRLAELGDYEEIVVIGERESVQRLEALTAHLRGLGYGEPVVRADGTVFFAQADRHHPSVALRSDGSFDVGTVDRKHRLARMALFDGMAEPLRAWRDALCREAVEDRLVSEIPAGLEALWREGLPPAGGEPLETPEARRAALLEWWVTRTCTPEGDLVREVIARYLATEVQPSPWPVTPEELLAVNARRTCADPLLLP